MKLCGHLYVRYCHQKGNSTRVIKTEVPKDFHTVLPQTMTFFTWVCEVHRNMLEWKEKLSKKKIKYGEMITYRGCYSDLKDLMGAFRSKDYIFDFLQLESLVAEFDDTKGKVSSILIERVTSIDSYKSLW